MCSFPALHFGAIKLTLVSQIEYQKLSVFGGSQVRIAPLPPTPTPPPTDMAHREHIYLQNKKIKNSDNGQPDAGASFSLNGLNEPEILLSLWGFQTDSVQSDLNTHEVSAVGTFPLRPLWRSCRTL